VAHPAQGGNGTKDVFYYDVDARQVVRLESTEPGHQYYPIHAGDYIYWEDDRDGDWNIYRYDLVAGVEERFTWNDQDQIYARIRGHLLTWTDYRWSCESYAGLIHPADSVIYDTETGVMRRVTSSSIVGLNRFAEGRWLVYTKKVGSRRYQVFSHDLVSDGLLDGPDGHVIPGPGEPLVP
jgi:Tol biopolymer transport system component